MNVVKHVCIECGKKMDHPDTRFCSWSCKISWNIKLREKVEAATTKKSGGKVSA